MAFGSGVGGGGFGGGGGGGGFGAFSAHAEESRKRTTSDRKLIARLYNYVKKYKRNLMIAVVSIIISSITALIIPYMHKLAIDQVMLPENFSAFIWWIPLFTSIVVVHYLVQYIQLYQMRFLAENSIARMREEMVYKLQIISLRYFSEGEVGRIMARPINDANMVRMFLRRGLQLIVLDISSIFGSLIIIFFLNFKLGVLATSIVPLVLVFTWFMGIIARKILSKSTY